MTRQEDRRQILRGVERYCRAIQTQDEDDFTSLWAERTENVLISLGSCFVGTAAIDRDFLVGRIQKKYSRIALIAERAQVRFISEGAATVVFQYSTDCALRETGEPYGIAGLETQVWVRERGFWRLCHVQYAKTEG